MTCIVGLVGEDGTVYMGGDSAGVSRYDLTIRADEKVFENGPYAMGFTTSFRMGQLLRYAFRPPRFDGEGSLERFMTVDFVDAARTCLKTGGFAKREHEVETGGTFLVGYLGRLFSIYSDYQVGYVKTGYDAVGCGAELAKGCLFATAKTDMTPEQRVTSALEAAEQFNAGVRGPFHLVTARIQGGIDGA